MISFIESFGGFESEITDPIRKMSMIIAAVKNLNIVDVLSHYGTRFHRSGGSRYVSLCPFHMDNHVGSFSVDAKKNSCWCYACNAGGDIINSAMHLFDMEWQEAVLQVAMDEELIDEDTYNELSEIEYVCKKTNNSNVRTMLLPVTKQTPETLKMWTDIYSYMAKEWKLIPEHERQLRDERQLADNRIKKDYFTMRTSDPKATVALILKIKKQFPEYADKLHTVPGFFEMLMSNGFWDDSALQYSGIGMLLRDVDDNIVAVQVRMDKKDENGLRYKYFSKEFIPTKYVRGGGSCGTPIDVVFPDKITERTNICITEGRFKAEILAKQGLIALSVQGVNNYAGIIEMLMDVERKIGRKLKTLHVFYDADLIHNIQVYKAGIALASYVTEFRPDITVAFAIWPEIYGKGIDDMIFAGYRNETKSVSFERFLEVFDMAYSGAEEETGIDASKVSKLSKEERTVYIEAFAKIAAKELL